MADAAQSRLHAESGRAELTDMEGNGASPRGWGKEISICR
jgi:hypothetical protein